LQCDSNKFDFDLIVKRYEREMSIPPTPQRVMVDFTFTFYNE